MNAFKKIIISFLPCCLIFSCDGDSLVPTSREDVNLRKFREQIQWMCENPMPMTRSISNTISIVDYEYRGELNTRTEIAEAVNLIFADDAYIAKQDQQTFDLEIITIGEYKARFGENSLLPEIQIVQNEMIKCGMSLVDISWHYNGEIVKTMAVVSENNGIVYNAISLHIIRPHVPKIANEVVSFEPSTNDLNINTIKANQKDYGPNTQRVGTNLIFTKEDMAITMDGTLVWYYKLSCTSSFDDNGILQNTYPDVSTYHHWLYSCSAGIIPLVGGMPGVSNYHKFKWIHATAEKVGLSDITIDGHEFVYPAGYTSIESGIEHHSL